MKDKDYPRLAISAFVLLLFGILVLEHPNSALLVGALIAMATQAVQYWLGSSKGSSDKSAQLERQATETQQVEVINPSDNPVPVEDRP